MADRQTQGQTDLCCTVTPEVVRASACANEIAARRNIRLMMAIAVAAIVKAAQRLTPVNATVCSLDDIFTGSRLPQRESALVPLATSWVFWHEMKSDGSSVCCSFENAAYKTIIPGSTGSYLQSSQAPSGPRIETLALTSASSTTPPAPPSSPSTRLSYPAHSEAAPPKPPYATPSNSQM